MREDPWIQRPSVTGQGYLRPIVLFYLVNCRRDRDEAVERRAQARRHRGRGPESPSDSGEGSRADARMATAERGSAPSEAGSDRSGGSHGAPWIQSLRLSEEATHRVHGSPQAAGIRGDSSRGTCHAMVERMDTQSPSSEPPISQNGREIGQGLDALVSRNHVGFSSFDIGLRLAGDRR